MAIWKITEKGPVKVAETKLKEESLMEENLEDWVINEPSLLGESLFIIGRQVMIPDIRDRLDILALDPQGNAVVIELKRGRLKDPVDMQALRYASYISKWKYSDFENQALGHFGKSGDPDFNFNEAYENFCAESGIDEVPDINSDQRMIIVGSEVRDKLGSVALWLREHQIDIKVIEVELYREGDSVFLQPRVIVPLPVSKFAETGKLAVSDVSRPWVTDGRSWHLDRRCSAKTREMLLKLDDVIRDNVDVEGPRWNQKFYVSYRVGNYNWLSVTTRSTMLRLRFLVKKGAFKQTDIAGKLGVQEFTEADSLSEKIGLPSSVIITNYSDSIDRVTLRAKEDFDIDAEQFLDFLKQAYAKRPR